MAQSTMRRRDPWAPSPLVSLGQVIGGMLVFALVAVLDWTNRPRRPK